MNIADLFASALPSMTGKTSAYGMRLEGSNSSSDSSKLANLLGRLRAGDTVSGEVLSLEGDIVSLKLGNNTVLNALLSDHFDLEPGKSITFTVRSTGESITLNPLFLNTAAGESTAGKALEMAQLPLNEDTVTLTMGMMSRGMGIDKASLTQAYMEYQANPEAPLDDFLDIKTLGLPVTEENLTQLHNYKNLSYHLETGLQDISEGIRQDLANLVQNGDSESSVRLFSSLNSVFEQSNSLTTLNDLLTYNDTVSRESILLPLGEDVLFDINDSEVTSSELGNSPEAELPSHIRVLTEFAKEVSTLFPDENTEEMTPKQIISALTQKLESFISDGNNKAIRDLLGNDKLTNGVFELLKEEWTIKPEEVADSKNIEELYSKLIKQLHAISEQASNSASISDHIATSSNTMLQNIDFLNQINQAYPYIQLPLKLSGGEFARGDLYVYSGGKKLSDPNGKVSALLHLDMKHLGPVDVYVTMDLSAGKHVDTNFTVASDEVLDLIADHIDELNSRLEQKGIQVSSHMKVKTTETQETDDYGNGGVDFILKQHTSSVRLAQYSFDVRT